MKKYKLLKPIPGYPVGTVCEEIEDDLVELPNSLPSIQFAPSVFPEWFEVVNERWYKFKGSCCLCGGLWEYRVEDRGEYERLDELKNSNMWVCDWCKGRNACSDSLKVSTEKPSKWISKRQAFLVEDEVKKFNPRDDHDSESIVRWAKHRAICDFLDEFYNPFENE